MVAMIHYLVVFLCCHYLVVVLLWRCRAFIIGGGPQTGILTVFETISKNPQRPPPPLRNRSFFQASYMNSVAGDYDYLELITNSKSGSFFFYSHDHKYIIKNMKVSKNASNMILRTKYYITTRMMSVILFL